MVGTPRRTLGVLVVPLGNPHRLPLGVPFGFDGNLVAARQLTAKLAYMLNTAAWRGDQDRVKVHKGEVATDDAVPW